jgi:hypothetical protein
MGAAVSTVSQQVLDRTERSVKEREGFHQDKKNLNGYNWIFGETTSLSIEEKLNRRIR